jgi:cell division protein FtsX
MQSLRAQAITLGIAAVLGFALAQWLVSAVGSQMPDGWLARIPGQLSALRVDQYTAAGLIGALAVTIVFSSGAVHGVTRRLAPASLLASTATDDYRRSRWRSILVAVEIALCSAVVITSATLVTQLTTLRSVDMGVDPARTSAVWVNLGSSALSDPSSRVDYYDRILDEAAAVPAVESIGGVSHNAAIDQPHLPPDRIVYRPIAQDPPPWLYLIVRARSGVGDAAQAVSEAIWRVNPDQPVDGPWTVAESIRGRTSHLRFLALTSIVLGVVGLVLAAAGLYGLTAWSVMSSRRSIAVRRAVGASHRQICSWFIAKWARIVVPGLIGGWVLQWGWTSILIAAITGLERPGPASTLLGLGLMALISAGAAALPLRSALISDNWPVLRGD